MLALRRHPVAWGVFAFTLTALPWLSDVWGLFSNEPLVPLLLSGLQALQRQGVLLRLIPTAIGLVLLVVIIYQQRKELPSPILRDPGHLAGPPAAEVNHFSAPTTLQSPKGPVVRIKFSGREVKPKARVIRALLEENGYRPHVMTAPMRDIMSFSGIHVKGEEERVVNAIVGVLRTHGHDNVQPYVGGLTRQQGEEHDVEVWVG